MDRLLRGSEAFTAAAPMGRARCNFASCALRDGRVFVAGGFCSRGDLSSCEIFDPSTNRWTEVRAMPTARYGCVARSLIVDGKEFVVVFGGVGSSAVESFDVANGTWERMPQMPTARSYACIWAVSDSAVLIGGGFDESFTNLDSVDLFDLRARRWRNVPKLQLPRPLYGAGSAQVLM